MTLQKQHTTGFTLIELLVVIAIISLLSSVVLASLSGARESARDTRRAQDFRQFRSAVNQYRNDHGGNFPGSGDGGGVQVSSECQNTDIHNDLIGGGYFSNMPTDPAETLQQCGEPEGNDENFYGWDAYNAGGNFCFSINNFETSENAGDLRPYNMQPDINFGGNANLNSAEFVYCFGKHD